jgi:hypothetical protein
VEGSELGSVKFDVMGNKGDRGREADVP